MKKLLALLLAALVASAALVACSNDKKSDKDDDDDEKSEVSSEVSSEVVSEGESSGTSDVVSDDIPSDIPGDNTDTSLVGTWVAEYDQMELLMGEAVIVNGEAITLPAYVSLTFDETNLTLTTGISATLEEAVLALNYVTYSFAYSEEMTFEEYLETVGNSTEITEGAQEIIAETETETAAYILNGNKITSDDGESEFTISLNGNEFTITDCNDEEAATILVGLTFVKQ